MKLLVILTLLTPLIALSNPKTICGESDDRILSDERPIGRAGRIGDNAGCTVTMISKSCAVSVGHCVDAFEEVQFNVPLSLNTTPQRANADDIYLRNKDFLRYKDAGSGDDWAVIKLKKNENTQLYPGEVQGYYTIQPNLKVEKGMKVRITGYGLDKSDNEGNLAQQTHSGTVEKLGGFFFKRARFGYSVDTMGGNSGSAVILEETNEIIGVHSHGTCTSTNNYNEGTMISKHKNFQRAIQQCLDLEKLDSDDLPVEKIL